MPDQESVTIDVPGVGPIDFPASMSKDQRDTAAARLYSQHQAEVEAAKPWTERYPKTAQVVRGAVNTLPAVGAMAGGVLSTPETLGAGTVAGAALGAGAGRGARDLVAEAIGLEPHTSPLGKGTRIALDTALTGLTEGAFSAGKALVAEPKAVVADILEGIAHPSKRLDAIVSYLRAAKPTGATLARPAWQSVPEEAQTVIDRYAPNVSGYQVGDTAAQALASQKSAALEEIAKLKAMLASPKIANNPMAKRAVETALRARGVTP